MPVRMRHQRRRTPRTGSYSQQSTRRRVIHWSSLGTQSSWACDMSISLWTPVGPFRSAVGTAFGTFTTRQDVSPRGAGIGDLSIIQGGVLSAGSMIKIEAWGEYSSTGAI